MGEWQRGQLERFFLRAWPAREALWQNGWVLRANDGYTGRANSATVLDPAATGHAAIAEAESFYRARGLPPRFRLLSFTAPQQLDRRLASRGYRRYAPTLVLGRPLGDAQKTAGETRAVPARDLDHWLDAYALCRGRPISAADRAAHREIVARVSTPLLTAIVTEDERPVACGASVADGARCALFDIAVAPRRRRAGWGRRLVEELLAWSASRGCRAAFLQVEMSNRPARRLYAHLSFHAGYYYWYRAALADPTGGT